MSSTSRWRYDTSFYLVLVAVASSSVAVTLATQSFLRKGGGGGRRRQDESNNNISHKDVKRKKNWKPTAYETLISNGTPLIRLEHVSDLIKRNIYIKMESLNPGGTGKDRAALSILNCAEEEGILPPPCTISSSSRAIQQSRQVYQDNVQTPSKPYDTAIRNPRSDSNVAASTSLDQSVVDPLERLVQKAMNTSRTGGLVIEGTSGSTGISLATLCRSRGHGCLVVLPDDQAIEKQKILTSLGAIVHVVPTAAISNPCHYVNLAKKAMELAKSMYGPSCPVLFSNQFENPANFHVHYHTTGPELYHQCPTTHIDAFVMSSGTGGTISGIGKYLKEQQQQQQQQQQRPNSASSFSSSSSSSSKSCQIVLVDPKGSSLYNKIQYGVAYASEQSERTIRKHRYDTIAEGIGLDRITQNFALGVDYIDSAIQVSDQEAVDMAHWILQKEGLWIGSSSAMNLVGAIRTALTLPEHSTVVTIICDGGQRHATRFWNRDFIAKWGLEWPSRETTDCETTTSLNGAKPSQDRMRKERIPDCVRQFLLST